MKTQASKLRFFKSSLLASFVVLFLTNCSFISYEQQPLVNEKIVEKIIAKDPENPSFKAFLHDQGFKDDQLPIKEWGLNELMLCALFFNTKIEIAKKEWSIAKDQQSVAAIKPPSSIGIDTGREGNNQDKSKKALGINFSTLFETANKAKIREEKAINQTLIKRLELRKLAWDIKTELTTTYLDYQQSLLNIQSIRNEVKMQNDIVNMLKKRKVAGIASSSELDLSQLELNKNIQKLNDEQIRIVELRAKLGKITGLTPEKFNLLTLTPLNTDTFIDEFDLILNNESSKNKLNNLGIYNRIDLRIALAQYALAESKLKLQIAEQYPDITFSPAYLYDYGASKWILGLSTLIPSANKNKTLINEAKKISDIEVLSIEKLQTSILNDIQKLSDNYQTNRATVKKGIEDNESILAIESGLDKKFNNGEIDRLEFTKEKLKNMQFKRKLYENKVALVQSGFDFESILQYPIIKQTQIVTNEK